MPSPPALPALLEISRRLPELLVLDPWRCVEAHHVISTRKLVDSDAEQAVLERLIESVKPPAEASRLHYLLFTPFRYPPLPRGSRFGTATDPSLWYGSQEVRTALAETAYSRLLFQEGTTADLGAIETTHTVFRVRLRTDRGIDLLARRFRRYRGRLASTTRYDETQVLGRALRALGIEALRTPSARDPDGGVNIAAFVPSVFRRSRPRDFETWYVVSTREAIEFRKRDYLKPESCRFTRDVFLVGGKLPAPAV